MTVTVAILYHHSYHCQFASVVISSTN